MTVEVITPSATPLRERAAWIFTCLSVLWSIELVSLVAGEPLYRFGILPRTAIGLRGIPLAPLIHHGPEHLALNTVPLVILGWLVLLRGPALFLRLTGLVALFGGFAVWACARPHYHIGASGVILGYFGYLVARAFTERSWGAVGVALLTVVLYGGMVSSVLPNVPEVSWESHLCGLLAGITCAWLFSGPPRPARRR